MGLRLLILAQVRLTMSGRARRARLGPVTSTAWSAELTHIPELLLYPHTQVQIEETQTRNSLSLLTLTSSRVSMVGLVVLRRQ